MCVCVCVRVCVCGDGGKAKINKEEEEEGSKGDDKILIRMYRILEENGRKKERKWDGK